MYTITVENKKQTFDKPLKIAEILNVMCPGVQALACFLGGSVLELGAVVDSDLEVRPITFADEEGRRIYERSLRFVLLLAAKRLWPELHVRIDNSLGYGVYMRLAEREATQEDVIALENEMKRITGDDLPFTRESWTREEAIRYFARIGESDKMHLLTYRPYEYFNVYCLDGMYEYFYGAMLPSTGYLKAFSVWKCRDGFVMQMPSPKDPEHPAAQVAREKHLNAFAQSTQWCRVLGCSTVADLNDMIRSGSYREFIRVNEALQDKAMAAIADEIYTRRAKAVFIAGPSSSGKTTFANRMRIHLKVHGLQPVLISLDDFYLDREKVPLDEMGQADLQTIYALDVSYLKECIGRLLSGGEAMMPTYDFHSGCRREELTPLRLRDNEILIIEGIHGLNPMLHEGFDPSLIYRIFITELTCINLDYHNRIRTTDARLMRRIVRDHQFRGTSPEKTLSMWNSVRRGEETWIFPYQEQADVVFNSALHYELPVVRRLAYDLLCSVPAESPNFLASRRLLKILHYMLPAPEGALREIPPLSILREFIGGNTFYDQ